MAKQSILAKIFVGIILFAGAVIGLVSLIPSDDSAPQPKLTKQEEDALSQLRLASVGQYCGIISPDDAKIMEMGAMSEHTDNDQAREAEFTKALGDAEDFGYWTAQQNDCDTWKAPSKAGLIQTYATLAKAIQTAKLQQSAEAGSASDQPPFMATLKAGTGGQSSSPDALTQPPYNTPTQPVPSAPPTGSTFPTSFDCAKVTRATEKLICADPNLAALDVQLASLYRQARSATADSGTLVDEQRGWLAKRDECTNTSCLTEAYNQRKVDLGRWLVTDPHQNGAQ